MSKKLAGPLTRAQRALAAQISGVFDCSIGDEERVFDGMDGGGHYAASAIYHGADWVFEVSLMATPCWHGGGRTRRLGWEYELSFFSADHNGRDVREKKLPVSEAFGQELLRCDHPAAMALASLPDPRGLCAGLREEVGELIGALDLKAQISKASPSPKAAGKAKRAAPAL